MKNLFKQEWDYIVPSQESQDVLWQKLQEHQDIEQKQKKSPKKLATALLLTASILFTSTVLAEDFGELSEDIFDFFSVTQGERKEYLSNGALILNQLFEGENGSIYLKEVIGDENITYIFYDFIAEEGTVLDKKFYLFEDQQILGAISGSSSSSSYSLEDDDKTDNVVSFVTILDYRVSLEGATINFSVGDLYGYDDYEQNYEHIRWRQQERYKELLRAGETISGINAEDYDLEAETPEEWEVFPDIQAIYGNWTTSFTADFKSYSKLYKINDNIETPDLKMKLKTMSVSPLSIGLEIEFWTYLIDNLHNLGKNQIIRITFTDGTTLEEETGAGLSYSTYTKRGSLNVTYVFPEILEKEIYSVTYYGNEFVLEEYK